MLIEVNGLTSRRSGFGMRVHVVFFVLLSSASIRAQEGEGAEYLQSAISELKNMNSHQNRRVDPTPSRRLQRAGVPPLTLTKGMFYFISLGWNITAKVSRLQN